MAQGTAFCLILLLLTATLASSYPKSSQNTNPQIVDLGYAKHAVSFTNTTDRGRKIKVFKNIRFAQPPTGRNRFQKPKQPPPAVKEIQDGLYAQDTRCVSAVQNGAGALFPGLDGKTFGSEDCLFLDVYVPDGVQCHDQVPVLHYLYGSGFAFGSKEFAFSPLGLFDQVLDDNRPVILVASNYRMGLYGWASSPHEAMDPNAGLWDGLAALQWTQKHITEFGGDPERVTTIGQSAGAGMLELLATSPRLGNHLPFQHAFLSSSALPLKRNVTERRQDVYEAILNATNCTSLNCLKQVSEVDLTEVNRYLINDVPSMSGGGNSGPGIGFGPVVDGNLVPDLTIAKQNLAHDARGLKSVIIGNMANEGAILSSDKGMPGAFPALARRIIPSATNETISKIQSMYSYPENHPEELAWFWTADAVFVCHSLALAQAVPDRARRYIMSIPPAYHAQDMYYYFFVDNQTTPIANIEIARSLQQKLGEFMYEEHSKLTASWPFFGPNETILDMTGSGFKISSASEAQVARCEFLNRVLADPINGI